MGFMLANVARTSQPEKSCLTVGVELCGNITPYNLLHAALRAPVELP